MKTIAFLFFIFSRAISGSNLRTLKGNHAPEDCCYGRKDCNVKVVATANDKPAAAVCYAKDSPYIAFQADLRAPTDYQMELGEEYSSLIPSWWKDGEEGTDKAQGGRPATPAVPAKDSNCPSVKKKHRTACTDHCNDKFGCGYSSCTIARNADLDCQIFVICKPCPKKPDKPDKETGTGDWWLDFCCPWTDGQCDPRCPNRG